MGEGQKDSLATDSMSFSLKSSRAGKSYTRIGANRDLSDSTSKLKCVTGANGSINKYEKLEAQMKLDKTKILALEAELKRLKAQNMKLKNSVQQGD